MKVKMTYKKMKVFRNGIATMLLVANRNKQKRVE